MKLGLNLGYWGSKPIDRFIELAVRAEALGFDIVCTAEAYGSDVFTPLAAIAARTSRIRLGTSIMQVSARTPTCAATTAMTLDHISNGRLCLGVGVSGPQVVEGWYGQPFRKPLERTREWLAVFQKVVAREAPVVFEGQQFRLPYAGEHATGLGKPLMSITTRCASGSRCSSAPRARRTSSSRSASSTAGSRSSCRPSASTCSRRSCSWRDPASRSSPRSTWRCPTIAPPRCCR
jgi:alkanesulfonate monooxygenase SsuD/methylene tetrahydromethanopterin reductase-like flavin-dependent oxidoreductase (luciferase family)